MLVYANLNTKHPQRPPHVFHDKPTTRYNISYKRHHKKND